METVCDGYTADSLKPALTEDIPFVLSNGYVCGRSYLFPVKKFEDMRNYEKNYEAYEKLRDEMRATHEGRLALRESHVSLRQEMVPEGPLPWKTDNMFARSTSVDLIRNHGDFFTPALKTNMVWQEFLLDLGVEFASEKYRSPFRDDAAILVFRERLKKEVLRLLDYIEKDPNYGTRLLLDD